MNYRRFGMLCLLVATIAGCALPKEKTPRELARTRWEQMRAKVKLQLAERSFESGQVDEAAQLCDEAIGLDAHILDGLLLMARVQLEKGQTGRAESALDSAAGLGQAVPELDYLRGMLAERREQRQDAADWYQRAYRADPNQVEYLLACAEAMLSIDQVDAAAELLANRQRDFEQEVRVQVLLAQAWTMLDKPREASDAYLSALRLAPQDAALREEAGLSLLTAGRFSEARTVIEPLFTSKAAKTPPTAELIGAWGAALIDARQPQQACAVLEKTVDTGEPSYSMLLLYARACLLSGRPVPAVDAARRACRLAPESVDARLLLAYAALTRGDRDTAVSAAQHIIAMHPNDPEALTVMQQAARLQVADAIRK